MVDPSAEVSEEQVAAKWLEMAPLIDRMMERVGDPDDFPVSPGSSLAGDDKRSNPYCVSHAVRACLVSSVDHMHAAKSLVLDLEVLHASAVYSLIRGSLENLAAAFWCRLPGSWDHLIASGMGPPWRVIEDARRVRLGQADRVECVGGRTVLR